MLVLMGPASYPQQNDDLPANAGAHWYTCNFLERRKAELRRVILLRGRMKWARATGALATAIGARLPPMAV